MLKLRTGLNIGSDTDQWPDPTQIADLVTRDPENQFYLWLIMKRLLTLHLRLDDWSWRVRYAAVIGLVKVCHGTSQDSLKDGLRTVAWNTLRKAGSVEKDVRVLKALKVLSVMAFLFDIVSAFLLNYFATQWFDSFICALGRLVIWAEKCTTPTTTNSLLLELCCIVWCNSTGWAKLNDATVHFCL